MAIRAVQGHSGQLAAQLIDEQTYKQAWYNSDAHMVTHATKSELLPSIMGLEAPGLLPGGQPGHRRRGQRGDVHCAIYGPTDPRLVASFRRWGVDVIK